MKKQDRKKLNLNSETTVKLSTLQLAQPQGGMLPYKSEDRQCSSAC